MKVRYVLPLAIIGIFFCLSINDSVFAESVTGGGYTVEQVIAPVEGAISGNGYTIVQSSLQIDGTQTGGGYIVSAPFGTSTPTSTPVTPPSSGGGGGGGSSSGGGYYVFMPPQGTSSVVTVFSTSTSATITVVTPSLVNNSTCSTRVTFSAPIDVGSPSNIKEDVKKLETFLITYEHEKLPVNGIYEPKDVEAVKRWQSKYQSYILAPMLLKKPTGTIYTLSQRQIERQTTASCGQKIVITSCPFFKTYVAYGDRGEAVKKIQQFLNIARGEKLNVNGIYGPLTRDATLRFQRAYKKDIFSILKLSFISGNWNEATRVKANRTIGCDILK